MAHAEKCPVCNGTGNLVEDEMFWFRYLTRLQFKTICNGCGGKGWIKPDAEEEQEQIELFEKK